MYCGKCGNVIQASEKFCSKCGTPNININLIKCRNCGNILQENEKFCSKCGASRLPSHCGKCGTQYEENQKFCPKCGSPREVVQENIRMNQMINNNSSVMNNQQINYNNNQPVMNNQSINYNNNFEKTPFWKKWDKNKIIISSVSLAALLLVVFVALFATDSFSIGKKGGSRTIMIYMVGSNLETQHALATRDLEDLDYSQTSKNGVNVLLIAGGTKAWKNDFVDASETSIYELGPNGFEKVDTRTRNNMGAIDNLSYFLNYAYKNYKSSNYDLIFWNHGGAVDGSEYDEITDDNLKIAEMRAALEDSPFKNKKLEIVSFRTCLNATVEVANGFKDYANYLVASEEVTIGSPLDSALRFINDINKSDSAIEYGKKEIEVYKETVSNYCNYVKGTTTDNNYCVDSTYSIIDLSKVSELKKTVNEFSDDLDSKLDSNIYNYANIRANMSAYGKDASNQYEMVDLYNMAEEFEKYSNNASKIKQLLNDAVVFNWSTNNYSHGLSVYFPAQKAYFLGTYGSVTVSDSYTKFITKFYQKKKETKNDSFTNFSNMTATVERKDSTSSDLEIELTEDQIKNIDRKGLLVFKDTKDGYYQPILNAKVEVEGNKLKANVKDNLIKISDFEYEDENSWIFMTEKERTKDYTDYEAYIYLAQVKSAIDPEQEKATLTVRIDKEHPAGAINSIIIDSETTAKSDTQNFSIFSPVAVDLKNYRFLKIYSFRYNFIDSNGNFNQSFKSSDSIWFSFYKNNEYKFIKADLTEEDLYAVFRVFDISGNEYDSKPIKLTK